MNDTPCAVRPEVAAFALLMERKLQANDHKPGWKTDAPEALTARVREEAQELSRAVTALERCVIWSDEPAYGSRGGNGWSRRNPATGLRQVGIGYEPMTGERRAEQLAKIAAEAADVANMAMMVADVCGQLAASGMEAPSGGETGTGSTEGDSPTAEGGDAQTGSDKP